MKNTPFSLPPLQPPHVFIQGERIFLDKTPSKESSPATAKADLVQHSFCSGSATAPRRKNSISLPLLEDD
ncbi:MAG: hypothetical protein OEM02_01325 [Desulfobulbaceae bacterium]|nr:hypothetical protein [Desulfobulbaceae bacterium]